MFKIERDLLVLNPVLIVVEVCIFREGEGEQDPRDFRFIAGCDPTEFPVERQAAAIHAAIPAGYTTCEEPAISVITTNVRTGKVIITTNGWEIGEYGKRCTYE